MFLTSLILISTTIITYKGSLHLMNFLLLMEMLVLALISQMNSTTLNWHFLYFFLIVAVCVSCYGISLLVSNTQNKNPSYFMVF